MVGVIVQHGCITEWRGEKPCGGGFCTTDGIVAETAMNEVITQTTVDNVVATLSVACQIDGFLQTSGNIGDRTDDGVWQINVALRGRREDSMQFLRQSIATGEDAAVVADDPVFS